MKEIFKASLDNSINDNNLLAHYYLHLVTLNIYNIPNCSEGIYGSEMHITSQ